MILLDSPLEDSSPLSPAQNELVSERLGTASLNSKTVNVDLVHCLTSGGFDGEMDIDNVQSEVLIQVSNQIKQFIHNSCNSSPNMKYLS